MTRDWENTFSSWSAGPGQTERDRIANAERMIREAISSNEKLHNKNINIFIQGSYRNNVNVRQDSDIDIGVECTDTFFPNYMTDEIKTKVSPTLSDATYFFAEFKNDIEEALVNKFGRSGVSRGKKSFDISENTYRVEADVTPFFSHRRYVSNEIYLEGVEMITDDGKEIINWPEQHYNNGVEKNTKTARRYKRTVRIFKKLANEMASEGIKSADIPSFLIECLIWNVKNSIFDYSTNYDRVKFSIIDVFNNTKEANVCSEWGEVSELKYLFRPIQPWTSEQANAFMSEAWNYIGFK